VDGFTAKPQIPTEPENLYCCIYAAAIVERSPVTRAGLNPRAIPTKPAKADLTTDVTEPPRYSYKAR
jgi:hypothetical protein